MKARGKFVIDHIERLALSLIEGTTACGDRVYPVYGVNSILRSRSLLCTYAQEGRAKSMGGASGRAGEPSIGGEPLLHLIGDIVSDSCSVNSKPINNDHVYNLPTSDNSSLSSHALRQAFPIWSLSEISHPCVQLSSCHNAFVQGKGGAECDSNASRRAAFEALPPFIEQSGMCNYPTAAYILFSNMCQWILIAVLSVWSVFSPPQSFWNVGMWSQPSQRALITNSGSYFCQFTAKLLQNFCFEPQSCLLYTSDAADE